MTKSTTPTTSSPRSLVSIGIEVTNTELVAIKVAAIERELLTQQAQHEGTIRDLKKEEKILCDSFDKEVIALGNATFDPKPAVEGLASLGIKVEADVVAQYNPDKKNIMVTLNVRESSRSWGNALSSARVLALSESLQDKLAKIESIRAKLVEAQTALMDVRKKLSQISTLERQSRAALALNTLSKTEEGRALVKEMENIPGLPGLPAPK